MRDNRERRFFKSHYNSHNLQLVVSASLSAALKKPHTSQSSDPNLPRLLPARIIAHLNAQQGHMNIQW